MTADTCIYCGSVVPEGRMVCIKCELDFPASKCTLPGGKPPGVTNEKEDNLHDGDMADCC